MKINTKFIIIFLFFGIIILPSSIYMFENFISSIEKNRFKEFSQSILKEKNNQISYYITHLEQTLLAINSNKIFQKFLDNKDNIKKEYINELFKTIALSDSSIYQIRYIDKKGQEIIKIVSKDGDVFDDKNKQNKYDTYYFQTISKLKPYKIWYSKMDLNRENGKIEIPYRPVIRIGLKVDSGVLIINLSLKKLLYILKSNEFEFCLIDKNNECILDTQNRHYNWSKYTKMNLTRRYREHDVHQFVKRLLHSEDVLVTNLNFVNDDRAKLLLVMRNKDFSNTIDTYLTAYIKLLVLLTLLAYFLLKPLYKSSELLEEKVRKRTKELYALNKNLQQAIDDEVAKNKERLEKIQQEQLENTKLATIGLLAAGITHEINTPLTYIKGNFEMLMDDISLIKDEKLKEYMLDDAKQIKDGITRISNIVESMRQMSSKSDDTKESVNIYNTLITALTLGYNKYKHISRVYLNGSLFSLDMPKDKFKFYSYVQPQKIEQVWIIIINNAMDELVKLESFDERRLDIVISSIGDKILIRFKDNAGGIDNSILDKVFEPLVSTKEFGGIGIGLNIASKIIEENRGIISAFNEDNGAVFEVILTKSEDKKEL